jgi:hypothetical protein
MKSKPCMAQKEGLVPYSEGKHAPEEYIEDLFLLFWPEGQVPLSTEVGLRSFW